MRQAKTGDGWQLMAPTGGGRYLCLHRAAPKRRQQRNDVAHRGNRPKLMRSERLGSAPGGAQAELWEVVP